MKTAAAIWRLLLRLVRELSDENAYARYLKQAGTPHSAKAWRAFADRRHGQKYRNAKCC